MARSQSTSSKKHAFNSGELAGIIIGSAVFGAATTAAVTWAVNKYKSGKKSAAVSPQTDPLATAQALAAIPQDTVADEFWYY